MTIFFQNISTKKFKKILNKPHKIKYLTLPREIKHKHRTLKVLSTFISNENCPCGSNLRCYELQDGFRMCVKNKQFVWFQRKNPIESKDTEYYNLTSHDIDNAIQEDDDIDLKLMFGSHFDPSPDDLVIRDDKGEIMLYMTCPLEEEMETIPKTPRAPMKNKVSKKKLLLTKQNSKCSNYLNGVVENYKCPLTDGIFDESGFDIDHIKEVAVGGTDNIGNLQLLCKCCHSVKTRRFMKQHLSR